MMIAEQQWGSYVNQMVFSNITTCTTLICQATNDNRLLGAHFVLVRDQQQTSYEGVLRGLRQLLGKDTIKRMYIVRVGEVWENAGLLPEFASQEFRADVQPDTFREALDYDGDVWVYETSGAGAGNKVSVVVDSHAECHVYVDGRMLRDAEFTVESP